MIIKLPLLYSEWITRFYFRSSFPNVINDGNHSINNNSNFWKFNSFAFASQINAEYC